MRVIKCPNCGAELVPQPEGYYKCVHCGLISEGADTLDEQDIIDLDNANYRRDQYDFDEALALCMRVLQRNPRNAEANRCALLAQYKIVYLKDAQGEYKATFLTPEADVSITQCGYYRNLPERMKREMDRVEDIRQMVIREAEDIPQYDVFISYKSDGEEAEWARDCYKMLKQRGKQHYSVFYDEESLGAKQAGWEPHIYAALKSSKCLILFVSSLKNLNSPWVRNEWRRFMYLQQSDPEKQIIVVGKNIDPRDLPPALAAKQMLTVEKKSWMRNVRARVKEICDDSNVGELLKNGDSYLLAGKFGKAKAVFKRVIELSPQCAEAYWGLLRCRLKAFDDYDIVKSKKELDKIDEFCKALRLAEENEEYALVQRFRNVQNAQHSRDASAFDRTNYSNYRKKTRGMRYFKRILIAVCIVAVVAAGAIGSWEYTHPLKYSVESNQATLNGTGLFFNFLSPDELTVDKYDGVPIVGIGDGALKNSEVKSVKLASSVQTIGKNAFAGSVSLTKVVCMSPILSIGDGAFADCTNLSSIEIGGTMSEIARTETARAAAGDVRVGARAFENCISLTSISLNGLTYLGGNAFEGCRNLTDVYIDSGRGLEIGVGAFDNVSDALTVRLPTVEEELYNTLKREYTDVTFETYTRDRVEEVCYFIDKIGAISVESLPAIERAETLYDALSPEEKGRVTNYGDLRDARAIYLVAVSINSIGTVTLQNEAAIKAAEEAYNNLNEIQKAKVSNRDALLDARAVFDAMKSISEIGSVTLQSKSAIERAEAAYSSLTEKQKGMVSNYGVLREARDTYDVSVTIDLIGQIGTVTEASGPRIEQAELAYNALSPTLRGRVTNYSILQEARIIYNVVDAVAKLTTITPTSQSQITAAENAYSMLTKEQQAKITNAYLLDDAREIYEVVAIIEGIGEVTLNKGPAISQAESKFDALSTEQQRRVGNQSDLKDARAVYDVMELIEMIGTVSASSRERIERAKSEYEKLTPAQRRKVSNYQILQSAIEDLAILDVEELIWSIGQVTLSSHDKIEAAETAYLSLTAAQKERVTNYSVLLDARHIYDLLTAIDGIGSVNVGKGTNYFYTMLTSTNVSDLNDSSFRNSIDSVTFVGIVGIAESVWVNVFPNLATVRYDLTAETPQTQYVVPAGNLTYTLVGSTTQTYWMQITAQAGTEVHLGLENFMLKYSDLPCDLTNAPHATVLFGGMSGITATGEASRALRAKEIEIQLGAKSSTVVKGGDGTNGSAGGVAITANSLMISSDAAALLVIRGGDGGDGVKGADVTISKNNYSVTPGNGRGGGRGGVGIECDLFAIEAVATVEVYGGNGGNGGDGGNVNGTSNSDGQPKLPAGGNGGIGGDGGSPIQTDAVTIGKCFSLKMQFGDGGDGGNGGHGGDAYETTDVRPDHGGNGGHGGMGGQGFCGGDGGNGGSGGHSFGAQGGFLGTSKYKGTSGNGGNGGKSGNSICSWEYSDGSAHMVHGKIGESGKAGAVGTTDNNPGAVSGNAGAPGRDGGVGIEDNAFYNAFCSLVSP